MLLTITCKRAPATDLGYLLHKHPERVQAFSLSYGKAHLFYPEVSEEVCTAALLLEIDPVELVRNKKPGMSNSFSLEQYVNDRPYVTSSFLSVAIAQVLSTALSGRCKDRPELAEEKLPLTAQLSVVFTRGGESLLRRLFEPLGYEVEIEEALLDEQFPEWGKSSSYVVTLHGETRVKELLSHLYVLLPVLDNDKHYFTNDSELEKLLRVGEEWLSSHPERALITHRFLRYQRQLAKTALERLETKDGEMNEESSTDEPSTDEPSPIDETPTQPTPEPYIRLNDQRLQTVAQAILATGATRILDLGCGEGKLIRLLLQNRQVKEVVGMDVALHPLQIARRRLHLDRDEWRVKLIQGSLLYRDARLAGFDAAAVVEVIEHLELDRLASFERVLFGHAKPRTVILTTPNVEYNVKYEGLADGKMRHTDHRFEWTRQQFAEWASRVADQYSYTVSFTPIGTLDEEVGSPTQMATFTQKEVE